MCLTRLGQVLEVDGTAAVVRDDAGRTTPVSLLAYDGPPPVQGTWLLLHSGFALAPLDDDQVAGVLASLRTVTGTGTPTGTPTGTLTGTAKEDVP